MIYIHIISIKQHKSATLAFHRHEMTNALIENILNIK